MKRLTGIFVLLLCLLFAANIANATTFYVSPSGNNSDGLSWTNAYNSVQSAINVATDNDIIYVDGYLSGSQRTYTPTTPYNIPTSRNGLQIIGWNRDANAAATNDTRPIISGTTLTANNNIRAVNGFYVYSDNVVIKNLIFTDFNEQAADVDDPVNGMGAGIVTANATSGHTFANNKFYNCNWGIYLYNSYGCTIGGNAAADGNTFYDMNTLGGSAGTGLRVYTSGGATLTANTIKYNTFTSVGGAIDRYGVYFGSGTAANAEFSIISYNTFTSLSAAYPAVLVSNVNNSIGVDHNTLTGCYLPIDIVGTNADLYVTNNTIYETTNNIDIRSDNNFDGFTLFEIMTSKGNVFTGGSDSQGVLAVTHYTDNQILAVGGYRSIFYNITTASADAVTYTGTGNCRLYVPGSASWTNTLTATGTINLNHTANIIKVYGAHATNSVLKTNTAFATPIFNSTGVGGSTYYNNLKLIADNSVNGKTTIYATDGIVNFDGVTFNTTGSVQSTAINVGIGCDGTVIQNNTFDGYFDFGIVIDPRTAVTNTISCNTFSTTSAVTNYGIYMHQPGAAAQSLTIKGNTFNTTGTTWDYCVWLDPFAGSSITVGTSNSGNFFNFGATKFGVYVNQNPSTVTIQYNKFAVTSPTSGKAIVNNAGTALTASYNYMNGNNTVASITGLITGANVSWAPVLTSGTDTDASTCGWQPSVTSLWAPVYTSASASAIISTSGNEYFTTISEAIADANTLGTDKYYVNLYDATFTENVTLGAGKNVYIRKATDFGSTVTVTPTAAAATFTVNVDGTSTNPVKFENITINSYNSAASNAGVSLAGSGGDGLDYAVITGCTFNSNNLAWNGIEIPSGSGPSNITITNNTFNSDATDNSIVAELSAAGAAVIDNLTITGNTFNWSAASSGGCFTTKTSLTNSTISSNTLNGGLITFYEGLSNTNYASVTVNGNTFSNTNATGGIQFINWPDAGTGDLTGFTVSHNLFNYAAGMTGIYIAAADGNLPVGAITANYNNFSGFTNAAGYAIRFVANVTASKAMDFTNNWYGHAAGPRAIAAAPTWQSKYTGNTYLTANSYDYSNQAARVNDEETSYDFYNNIDFTPWLSTVSGSVGAYTGTSFYPIYNENGASFPNTNYAVDGTTSGPSNTIYYRTGTYSETGEIEVDWNNGTVTNLTFTPAVAGSTVTIQGDGGAYAQIYSAGMNLAGVVDATYTYSYLNMTNGSSNLNEIVYARETVAGASPSINVSNCNFTKGAGTLVDMVKFDGGTQPLLGSFNVVNNTFTGIGSNSQLFILGCTSGALATGNTFDQFGTYGVRLLENLGAINLRSNTFKGTASDVDEVGVWVLGDVNAATVNIGGSLTYANTFGTSSYKLQGGIKKLQVMQIIQ